MTERFDSAAIRHHETAALLMANSKFDDAGYHFGMCAETAIKSGLRESGMEAHWKNAGINMKSTPMNGHWRSLAAKISNAQHEISLYAQGRRASILLRYAFDLTLHNDFTNWSIDIRYDSIGSTPVCSSDLTIWESRATDLLLELVL